MLFWMKLHVFFYLDCRPFSLLLAWNGDITGTDLSNCRSILAFSDAQQIRRLSDVFLGGQPRWHLGVAQPGAGLILPPAHFPAISGLWNTEREREVGDRNNDLRHRAALPVQPSGWAIPIGSQLNRPKWWDSCKTFFLLHIFAWNRDDWKWIQKELSLAFESPTNNARR